MSEQTSKPASESQNPYAVDTLMVQARQLAANYRRTTGKTLPGVSGELAVYDAVRLLKLQQVEGQSGYEAIGTDDSGDLANERVQIKGRTIFSDTKNKSGLRVGQIKMEQDWDSVVLVLMDDDYEPTEVYEVDRQTLIDNAASPDSKQAKRGAMTVARFKKVATLAWSRETGDDKSQSEAS